MCSERQECLSERIRVLVTRTLRLRPVRPRGLVCPLLQVYSTDSATHAYPSNPRTDVTCDPDALDREHLSCPTARGCRPSRDQPGHRHNFCGALFRGRITLATRRRQLPHALYGQTVVVVVLINVNSPSLRLPSVRGLNGRERWTACRISRIKRPNGRVDEQRLWVARRCALALPTVHRATQRSAHLRPSRPMIQRGHDCRG